MVGQQPSDDDQARHPSEPGDELRTEMADM